MQVRDQTKCPLRSQMRCMIDCHASMQGGECNSQTLTRFNIDFKAVPICESCANKELSVIKWYNEYLPGELCVLGMAAGVFTSCSEIPDNLKLKNMKVEIEVTIPSLPNFIQVGTENRDVKHFTDEQLLMIAGEWTDALLKHAEKRRKAPDEVKLRKAWDGVLAEDR